MILFLKAQFKHEANNKYTCSYEKFMRALLINIKLIFIIEIKS